MHDNLNIKHVILSKVKNIKYYYIDKDESINQQTDKIAAVINSNCDMLILNGQNTTSDKFLNIAKQTRQLCSIFNVALIIDDRCDIAKIVDSDGIILSNCSYSIHDAKKIIDRDKLFGMYDNKNNKSIEDIDFALFKDKIIIR